MAKEKDRGPERQLGEQHRVTTSSAAKVDTEVAFCGHLPYGSGGPAKDSQSLLSISFSRASALWWRRHQHRPGRRAHLSPLDSRSPESES